MYLGLVCLLLSCSNPKEDLLNTFQEIYGYTLEAQYDSLVPFLNEESLQLRAKITDPQNMNLESMISLGKKYRLKYTCINFLSEYGEQIKKEPNPNAIFSFMGLNNISFFDYYDAYQISESETRTGADYLVGFYRTYDGKKKISWARFDRNDDDDYTYDLLYSLQIEERKQSFIYKDFRKKNKDRSIDEILSTIYDTKFTSHIDQNLEKDLIRKRRDMYNKLASNN